MIGERPGVPSALLTLITLFVTLLTVFFLYSPGTGDMKLWETWAANVDVHGPVSGFAANKADYPPLTSVALLWAVHLSRLVGTTVFVAIKGTIALALCLTSLLFWLWTHDPRSTLILHLALLLNSVALGYLDIYFAPGLLLSLWALKEEHLALFTICFAMASLTKWQPLVIAPFLLLYLLGIRHVTAVTQIRFRRLFWNVVLPAFAILVGTVSVFGVIPDARAFKAAVGHTYLSGNALNFNWILTHWLHVYHPDTFGALVQGRADLIVPTAPMVMLLPRALFCVFFILTLATFFRRAKTFETTIQFSLIGYLAYFTFNTGVHENHLFLATILAVILQWMNRAQLPLALVVILISNINLFAFYGIDGRGPGFPRVLGQTVDMALLLSILNVGAFVVLCGSTILAKEANIDAGDMRTRGHEAPLPGRMRTSPGARSFKH